MMKRLLVLLLGGALAGAAFAQQYRWVDKDGGVQYGDTPPPGVKATRLRGAPAPAAPAASQAGAKAQTPAERDAEFRKRQEEAAKARDKQEAVSQDSAAKKQNCANAQEAMRTLEVGRVRKVDPKGEYYFLEDAQIEQEKAQVRKSIADWC